MTHPCGRRWIFSKISSFVVHCHFGSQLIVCLFCKRDLALLYNNSLYSGNIGLFWMPLCVWLFCKRVLALLCNNRFYSRYAGLSWIFLCVRLFCKRDLALPYNDKLYSMKIGLFWISLLCGSFAEGILRYRTTMGSIPGVQGSFECLLCVAVLQKRNCASIQ